MSTVLVRSGLIRPEFRGQLPDPEGLTLTKTRIYDGHLPPTLEERSWTAFAVTGGSVEDAMAALGQEVAGSTLRVNLRGSTMLGNAALAIHSGIGRYRPQDGTLEHFSPAQRGVIEHATGYLVAIGLNSSTPFQIRTDCCGASRCAQHIDPNTLLEWCAGCRTRCSRHPEVLVPNYSSCERCLADRPRTVSLSWYSTEARLFVGCPNSANPETGEGHSSRCRRIHLGIELEYSHKPNDGTLAEFCEAFDEGVRPSVRDFKSDGSLIDGVETALQPHTLRALEAIDWTHLRTISRRNTEGAGMHVHVSRSGLPARAVPYLAGVFSSDLLLPLYGRDYNSWCAKTGVAERSPGKYFSVNTSPRSTVEVRVFETPTTREDLLGRAAIVHAAAEFAKYRSRQTGIESPALARPERLAREFVRWAMEAPPAQAPARAKAYLRLHLPVEKIASSTE